MQACAGPGKSTVLAWCGLWFLGVMGEKGNHPKGAAVAVTQDNLKDNLWPEISKWQQVSPYMRNCFHYTKSKIFSKDHPETWFLSARSYSRSANTEEQGRVLSGIHSKYVVFLIDESGDIPPAILKSAEQAMSTDDQKFGRILQAGNPTSHEGMLYAASDDEDWEKIRITGDPEDPDRSPRIDMEWARGQIKKYGRDDPWVMSYILGQFPETSINTLLSPTEVSEAMQRKPPYDSYAYAQKRIGVDVARFGCFDDKTEILTDNGWMFFSGLTGEEQVLSSEVSSGSSEWMPINEVHKYDFDGYLNEVNTTKQNFCVTDNHKFPVRTSPKKEDYIIKEYKDLPKEFVIESKQQWSGESPSRIKFEAEKQMPNGGTFDLSKDYDFNDWCEFLGWFISEGNVYQEKRKNGRKRIMITQLHKKKMKSIQELLTRMNINWRLCSNKKQVEFSNKAIGQHLQDECGIKAHNKKIPKYVKDASPHSIKIFLESFRLGDGTCKANGLGVSYTTSSTDLVNDIQECLAKTGQCGVARRVKLKGSTFNIEGRVATRRHDTYVVYQITKPTDRWYKKSKILKTKYKGQVYCVSTKYKTICVRRHGVVMWSGNSDSTVLFPRQGLMSFAPVEMRGARTNDIAARVAAAKAKWNSELELVDGTGGYGGGVVDSLIQAGHNPYEIMFSGKATDPKFFNKRAEMWFRLANWVKRGGALPDHDRLRKELSKVTYTFKNGKFAIVAKEQMKKDLGFSPDFGDALCLTFAIDEMPNSNTIEGVLAREKSGMVSDYDPFGNGRE